MEVHAHAHTAEKNGHTISGSSLCCSLQLAPGFLGRKSKGTLCETPTCKNICGQSL
jgi:hypothetical protein